MFGKAKVILLLVLLGVLQAPVEGKLKFYRKKYARR